MSTNISEFFRQHRALKIIVVIFLIKMALLTIAIMAIGVFFNYFLDVTKVINQNSLVPITYSKYSVSYARVIPRIILENCSTDFFSADKARISLSELSLLTFNPKIKSIKFTNAQIASNKFSLTDVVNHNKLLEQLIDLGDRRIDLSFYNLNWGGQNFSEVSINNSTLGSSVKAYADHLVIKASLSRDRKANVFDLNIKGKTYTLVMQEEYDQREYKSGVLNLNMNSENILAASLVFENNRFLIKDISGDNKWFKGSGQVDFDKGGLSLNVAIDHLDLSNLTLNDFAFLQDWSNFPQLKSNLNAKLQISDLMIFNQKISNLSLALDTDDFGNLNQNLNGNVGTDGSFSVEGVLQNGVFYKVFDGSISIQHNNFNVLRKILGSTITGDAQSFNFESDVAWSPFSIDFQGISSSLGQTKLEGDLSYKTYGLGNKWEGILKVQGYNADDENNLFKDAADNLKAILFKSYDKDYVQNFLFLNKDRTPINLNIIFNDAIFSGQNFDHLHFVVDAPPKQVKFNFFNIKKQDYFITGIANVTFPSFEPSYAIAIFDGKIPDLGFNSVVGFKEFLEKKLNLRNMGIDLSMRLGEVSFWQTPLTNIYLKARSYHAVIILDKLNFNLQGGDVALNGNIPLYPFGPSLGYSYSNIDLGPIFADASILPGLQGAISTNGTMHFTGDTLKEMLYTLTLDGKIVGIEVMFPYLSIDKTIAPPVYRPYGQKDNTPQSPNTTLGSVDGSYQMFQGIISSKDLKFANSNKFNTDATANLNIYTGAVSFDAKMYPPYKVNPFTVAPLMTLTVGGTLSDPLITLDTKPKL
ncbi:hypothetical protein phytr_6870 [Candidatus Phycorickettsia trachydisci]|uniref:Uncharacterized protein n=1 Tax=Candidatus Phycorickettsia trachydisci TaxID=2115978 RepID=A0A2P1P8M2_9RICK|nr:AsmA-like C-terminal region-containing protein [Candidatus Phycorickettsia trachydisci]AVP87628.1 hypothetical protein phytr_6870 [Candidatus Phycorickettsia trachydisci]